MDKLKRRQYARRLMYSYPVLLLLFALVIVLARGAVGIIGKQVESGEVAALEKERATALLARQEDLERKVERLKTEEGIKEEIRERFSVAAEGEHVAVIVEEKPATTTKEAAPLPWYKRFWNAIRY